MFAGDVASGTKVGRGGGAIPLLNDCRPRVGPKPVGSVVHSISK
jgi:hypothetical protein